jgi:hypothetical protein
MKNSKSAFIALAFVLGIGGAFASKVAQAKPTGEQWYVFKGDQSQIDDLTKYDPSPTDPGCTTGTVRCAVLALPNPTNANQPDLAHISQEERKN